MLHAQGVCYHLGMAHHYSVPCTTVMVNVLFEEYPHASCKLSILHPMYVYMQIRSFQFFNCQKKCVPFKVEKCNSEDVSSEIKQPIGTMAIMLIWNTIDIRTEPQLLLNDCLIQFLPDSEIWSPDDLNALKFFSQQQLTNLKFDILTFSLFLTWT